MGEAYTLLTVPPGPDITPYHHRGLALLKPPQWHSWLDGSAKSLDLLKPTEPGSLAVSQKA